MEKIRYSDILNGVNENWSVLEKAKYIYDQIGKISQYDERFVYSRNDSLLRSIYDRQVSIDEPVEPVLICKSLNQLYSQLLDRLGIKNRIIEKPSEIKAGFSDIALILYDEENNPYFTAIAADLQRCKYGMKTQFFGGCDKNYKGGARDEVIVLSPEGLRHIDEVTGYVKEGGEYSDQVFKLMSEDVKQGNEFKKKMNDAPNLVRSYLVQKGVDGVSELSDDELSSIISDFTMDDIIRIKMMIVNFMKHHDDTYGFSENKKQSVAIFNSLFNKSEKKRYDSFDMIREDGDSLEVLSLIRFKLSNDSLYYLYSQDTHEYELLPIEEAIKIDREYKSKSGRKLIEERE